MSKYTALIKDTVIFGIGNFTTKLIYFFLMPIYTLTLSTYEFGIADLLNNSLQLVIPILTLSISDAVFRFSLDKDTEPKKLLSNGIKVLSWSYLIVLCTMAVVYVLRLEKYWYIFGVLYITESLKVLFAQFTRGLGKVKEYALNGIIAAGILFGTSFLFLKWLHLGIDGYLWAYVAANSIACIYLVVVVRIWKHIDFKVSDKILLRSMLAFSLPLTPNMLSWWITNVSARYIIAYYCGLSLSGLFAAASKIPALINVISSIFQLSWQFASVKEYQQSDKSAFYSIVLRYYSMGIIIIGSIIIILLPYISYFILKGNFYTAWVYTPLLLYSAILGCFSIFFGTFYAVVKDNRRSLKTTIIGAGLNIIICFITIPFLGVLGALIANVISYVTIVLLRIRDSKKYVRLEVSIPVTTSALILLFVESVCMMIQNYFISFIPWLIPFILLFLYRRDIITLCSFIHTYIQSHRNAV